jgi:uncharacterized protein YebE (UPF0316 family)
MTYLAGLPIWALAIVIFFMRIVDVTMGTMRTLAIVEGRVRLSVALGFIEVSVWVVAIAQVITRLHESPLLVLGYACGFAAGNGVGILVERRLALGMVVLRILSRQSGSEIAMAFRSRGQRTTAFVGEGAGGSIRLIYALCRRRDVTGLLQVARGLDREMLYVVERASQWGQGLDPVLYPTGWRAFWKKK